MKPNNPSIDGKQADQYFSTGTRIVKGMVEESTRKNRRVAIIAHSMSTAHMAQIAASLIIDSQKELVRVISSEEINLIAGGEQTIHLYPNLGELDQTLVNHRGKYVVDDHFALGNNRNISVVDSGITEEIIRAFETEILMATPEKLVERSFVKTKKSSGKIK